MNKQDKERIIQELLKSDNIRNLYDTYIIKSITFETWVRDYTDYVLRRQTESEVDNGNT